MANLSTSGWVIFSIDEQRYGLPYVLVKRITRVVNITAVPNMPVGVLGLINVQGQIILVIDIRQRLGLPPVACKLQDALVIAESGKQTIGFIVDEVSYIENLETSFVQVKNIIKDVECADRIIKDKDGIIYVLNIEKILNKQDENILRTNKKIHKESQG